VDKVRGLAGLTPGLAVHHTRIVPASSSLANWDPVGRSSGLDRLAVFSIGRDLAGWGLVARILGLGRRIAVVHRIETFCF